MDVVVSGQLFSYLNAKIHKMHFNTALFIAEIRRGQCRIFC